MRVFILVLMFALASVAISSAATDEEIKQFARGVLAAGTTNFINENVSFGNDNLMIIGELNPSFDRIYDLNMVASMISMMANAANTIIKQYPGRFNWVDLKIYNSRNKLIGMANITAKGTSI